MFGRIIAALALAAPLIGAQQPAVTTDPRALHPWVAACENGDGWDKPGPPFQIHGDTWYVGTCGIAAILVTSDDGHVLIDSGTDAGAQIVLANIRALGFDPADVKLLLNSHEHFDHVGGMARLQEATGAPVVTSMIGAQVMTSGQAHPNDPQAGMHKPMRPVPTALPVFEERAQYLLDRFGFWPIATPGHTPGAMSWMWRACRGEACRIVVYADSLSPFSSDTYRFSDHPEYVEQYWKALARIEDIDCQILLTPHPSADSMREKLIGSDLARQFNQPCRNYSRAQAGKLRLRLATETQSQ